MAWRQEFRVRVDSGDRSCIESDSRDLRVAGMRSILSSIRRIATLAPCAVEAFALGHADGIVGDGVQAFLREVNHAVRAQESRSTTGRWRSGPSRRSAARATGRPRSRRAPPGCTARGTPHRRCESCSAFLPARRTRCASARWPACWPAAAASSRSRTRISAPNASSDCRARSPRCSVAPVASPIRPPRRPASARST